MGIRHSVGKYGINLPEDVIEIQRLLNKNIQFLVPLMPLEENGRADEPTFAAIEEYQRRAVGLTQPDGRVDPGGATWKKLAGLGAAAAKLVQLPFSGVGYYLYTTVDRTFGTPAAVESLRRLGQKANELIQASVGIGDMSYEKGGPMNPHRSHQKGVDVDLRPLRSDGKNIPVYITSPDYSRERTAKIVEVLRKDANVRSILFNDREIKGVVTWAGHDNHLHVSFKK